MSISDLRGIDISSWQKGISPASINSVDFAILKISEGQTWVDPCFDEFYNAATIPLGAYVYSHATTEAEARAEATHALHLANGRKLPLGIYIDVEEQKQLALRDSVLTAVVKAFCDTIKEGGYRAGAYGSNGQLWAKVGLSYLGDDVIMWTAQWGGRPSKGDVWQFTSTDRVDGYGGNVDGNKVLSERFGQLVVAKEEAPAPYNPGIPDYKDDCCEVSAKMPIIKYGDKGLHVKIMQIALIGKGFSCGWMGADGDYGQQTKIGLYQFQQAKGIKTDNICESQTWNKLLEV